MFLPLLCQLCLEQFGGASAVVAIPFIFQVVVLVVKLILTVTAIIFLEFTMCQGVLMHLI